MKTTEECLEALTAGHTLITKHGQEVWLDAHGGQCSINMGNVRKGRPYAFSTPSEWSIKPEVTKSFWMKLKDLLWMQ